MLPLDLTKTSQEMIYALLTHVAGRTITTSDVTVSAPSVIAGAQAGQPNTNVTLTFKEGSTVIKPGGATSLVRKLTRIDLGTIATTKGFTGILSDDISKYTDATYVVGKVNAGLGTVLTASDITLDNAQTVEGVLDVDVTMAADHYGLIGKVHLKVTDNVDHRPTLETAFADEAMDGFGDAVNTNPMRA